MLFDVVLLIIIIMWFSWLHKSNEVKWKTTIRHYINFMVIMLPKFNLPSHFVLRVIAISFIFCLSSIYNIRSLLWFVSVSTLVILAKVYFFSRVIWVPCVFDAFKSLNVVKCIFHLIFNFIFFNYSHLIITSLNNHYIIINIGIL